MQVTIKTDAGEFTADSIKEARKLEAKAKREESKRIAEVQRKYTKAKLESEGLAMRFVRLAYDKDEEGELKDLPRGYCYIRGDSNEELKITEMVGYREESYSVYSREWAELGSMYSVKIIGSVTCSFGICLLHLRVRDTGYTYFAAVGVCEGLATLSDIPADIPLTPERFNQE